MSEWNSSERDYVLNTLENLDDYSGEHEVTMLINSFVGLIILPKERYFNSLPSDLLIDWGIKPSSIISWGKRESENDIQELVHQIRNSTAHIKFEQIVQDGEIVGLSFADRNGFQANLKIPELENFVRKLADYMLEKVYI